MTVIQQISLLVTQVCVILLAIGMYRDRKEHEDKTDRIWERFANDIGGIYDEIDEIQARISKIETDDADSAETDEGT